MLRDVSGSPPPNLMQDIPVPTTSRAPSTCWIPIALRTANCYFFPTIKIKDHGAEICCILSGISERENSSYKQRCRRKWLHWLRANPVEIRWEIAT
jgi:hypothetical protein